MTKRIMKLILKKRYKTIHPEKSEYHKNHIVVYKKHSEDMIAVIEKDDKGQLKTSQFNHFTDAQRIDVEQVLNNFDKVYKSL